MSFSMCKLLEMLRAGGRPKRTKRKKCVPIVYDQSLESGVMFMRKNSE